MSEHRSTDAAPWWTPWRGAAGAVAIGLILAQAIWRGAIAARGWYGQTDFALIARSRTTPFAELWDQSYLGAFSPGGWLLTWLRSRSSPLEWGLAWPATVAAQAVAAALLWLVLTRLLPGRWIRVAVLAWFCFTPLTLWVTQWWSFSLTFWIGAAAVLAACWALLVWLAGRDLRAGVAAVALLVVAVLFEDRLWFAPLILITLIAVMDTAPTLRGRVASLWRAERGLLAALLAVLVVFPVVRLLVVPMGWPSGGESDDALTALLRNLGAQVWGGPWQSSVFGHGYLTPHSWSVGAGVLITVALLAVTLQRGGVGTRIAWIGLVLCLLVAVGAGVLQSGGGLLAAFGLAPRVSADVAVPFAVLVPAALREVEIAIPVRFLRAGGEALVAGLAVVLLAVSCAISTSWLTAELQHRPARAYVDQVRESLRDDPTVVLLDGSVPSAVMSSMLGSVASVATIADLIPEQPPVDLPSERLRVVARDGSLKPITLTGAVRAVTPPDATCGYHVTRSGVDVPLASGVPHGRWVARLGYYTDRESFVSLQVGETSVRFGVHSGLHAVDVPLSGPISALNLQLDDASGTLCLASVEIGLAQR